MPAARNGGPPPSLGLGLWTKIANRANGANGAVALRRKLQADPRPLRDSGLRGLNPMAALKAPLPGDRDAGRLPRHRWRHYRDAPARTCQPLEFPGTVPVLELPGTTRRERVVNPLLVQAELVELAVESPIRRHGLEDLPVGLLHPPRDYAPRICSQGKADGHGRARTGTDGQIMPPGFGIEPNHLLSRSGLPGGVFQLRRNLPQVRLGCKARRLFR